MEEGVVGEVTRGKDNLLIRGDALHALTSVSSLPQYKKQYLGKVKCAYIDPPFNTKQAFAQYDDNLEHSVWLTMMRDRIKQVYELLHPTDGSLWVHLDDAEMAYCKVILDEEFGRRNFVATIVWEKAPGAKGDTDIGAAHDYILIYAKSKAHWKKVRNLLVRTVVQEGRFANPDDDPRGPWRQGADSTAKSGSEENRWPITSPSGKVKVPAKGRFWAFAKTTFDKAVQEDRVYWGKKNDAMPIIKTYRKTVKVGVVPTTWWTDDEAGSNQEAKRDHLNKLFPDVKPFDTPKPERLLQRILHIATNPGDIVLDCFAGSGTTAAVAHKMGRRWVTVERSATTVAEHTLPRLRLVVEGKDPLGITPTVGWAGGGGFTTLDISPSMFSESTLVPGLVYLSEWATEGWLAEATAAQLGYSYEPQAPLAGRKGRSRLAVVDAMVGEPVLRLLVASLGEKELLEVAATSLDEGAEKALAQMRPGSRVRKIPHAILLDYQRGSDLREQLRQRRQAEEERVALEEALHAEAQEEQEAPQHEATTAETNLADPTDLTILTLAATKDTTEMSA